MKQLLALIKGRHDRSATGRALLVAALHTWKLARLVPGINRLRVTLPVGPLRMRVRAFSYDDLLTTSAEYEPIVRRLAPPPGATAVDAGAFIGRHTLDLAAAVGESGRVIAIEPQPESFSLLQANVAKNSRTNVTCVPCALGDREGAATLRCGRETSTAHVVARPPAGRRERAVCVRSLDALLADLGVTQIDFLKIDVEGAELAVLEGARQTLANSPGALLVIEIHGDRHERHDCPVAQWLTTQGLACEETVEAGRRFYVARAGVTESPPTPAAAAAAHR